MKQWPQACSVSSNSVEPPSFSLRAAEARTRSSSVVSGELAAATEGRASSVQVRPATGVQACSQHIGLAWQRAAPDVEGRRCRSHRGGEPSTMMLGPPDPTSRHCRCDRHDRLHRAGLCGHFARDRNGRDHPPHAADREHRLLPLTHSSGRSRRAKAPQLELSATGASRQHDRPGSDDRATHPASGDALSRSPRRSHLGLHATKVGRRGGPADV